MAKQANKIGSNPLISSVIKQVVGQDPEAPSSPKEFIGALLDRLKTQGIKSITYRFPVEEISEFDKTILDIQRALGGKRVNKNDVIRTSVNLTLEDWQRNGKKSLIFRLLSQWAK